MPERGGGNENGDEAERTGFRPSQSELLYRLEERVRALSRQLDRMEREGNDWRRGHEQNADARFRTVDARAERIEERLEHYVTKETMQREFRPVDRTFGMAGNVGTSLLIAALMALIGWIWSHGP